ncbi:hypothetical protein CP157_03782 (plasmid) [Paracoccus marcusii]|uniref:DUF6998 domain-containing protein n=1 Tax=Paracoccus marcusii TaxID=59779 RepID=UPI001C3D03B6|nr:hypothetical protein [Paracoccus marcusii]QXI65990.1 hypothetical protein CP157_03782 [Paracoccus marcusii]
MSLSQVQIIRSLAEALQWFEKELSWGAEVAELRHLTGRIGELYTAMIMRGQMAVAVNQVGYDVVSAEGDKISVKTFTTSTRVDFKASTLHHATRVMVLQILIEEGEPSIREALDCSVEELRPMLRDVGGQLYLPVNRIRAATEALPRNLADLQVVASANWRNLQILRLENGTILVKDEGGTLPQALPVLRQIARDLNVDVLNLMGNPKNTRTLGADIIKSLA